MLTRTAGGVQTLEVLEVFYTVYKPFFPSSHPILVNHISKARVLQKSTDPNGF